MKDIPVKMNYLQGINSRVMVPRIESAIWYVRKQKHKNPSEQGKKRIQKYEDSLRIPWEQSSVPTFTLPGCQKKTARSYYLQGSSHKTVR